MALLIICMILAVTDGVCKWGFGIKLSKLRSELAELRVDRERVGGERAKLETESNYLNVAARRAFGAMQESIPSTVGYRS